MHSPYNIIFGEMFLIDVKTGGTLKYRMLNNVISGTRHKGCKLETGRKNWALAEAVSVQFHSANDI
jgi:hypothetical protein